MTAGSRLENLVFGRVWSQLAHRPRVRPTRYVPQWVSFLVPDIWCAVLSLPVHIYALEELVHPGVVTHGGACLEVVYVLLQQVLD